MLKESRWQEVGVTGGRVTLSRFPGCDEGYNFRARLPAGGTNVSPATPGSRVERLAQVRSTQAFPYPASLPPSPTHQ